MVNEKTKPASGMNDDKDDIAPIVNDPSASKDSAIGFADTESAQEAEWQALFASSEAMLIEMANRAEEEDHAGLTWPIDPKAV